MLQPNVKSTITVLEKLSVQYGQAIAVLKKLTSNEKDPRYQAGGRLARRLTKKQALLKKGKSKVALVPKSAAKRRRVKKNKQEKLRRKPEPNKLTLTPAEALNNTPIEEAKA